MIHIRFNTPLGVPDLGAPKKCFLDGLISAGASLLGGLAGSATQSTFTKEQQRLQSKLNREEMSHSMNLQRAQQEWLMNNQYGKTVSGMINAGLNPATANGVSPAVPSAGSPHTGSSGPAAGMPNIDVVNAYRQGELLDAQIENIREDSKKKRSESLNKDADTRIKEYEADPEIWNLRKSGLSADVLRTYAETDAKRAEIIRIGSEVKEIASRIGLNEANTEKAQADAAKSYADIMVDLQSISESEQRIALMVAQEDLNRAEAGLAREKTNTEKYQQKYLTASTDETYARAGLERAEAGESRARQIGHRIANRINKWRQDVLEMSGSKEEQAAQLGAKRLLSGFIPFYGKFFD